MNKIYKQNINIRLPPRLRQKAIKRAEGMEKTLSEYVRSLIEADIQKWENEKKT